MTTATNSIELLLSSLFTEEERASIKDWIAQIKREMYLEQKELIEDEDRTTFKCKYRHPPISLLLSHKEVIIEQQMPYIDPEDSSVSFTHRLIEGSVTVMERYISFNTKTIQLNSLK